MLETKIRPMIQMALVDPVAKIIGKHLHPNSITVASLLIGIFAAICIALDWKITAVILILLSGYLDILDGTVARLTHVSSDFGTMLDILSDRTVEVAIIIAFAIRSPDLSLICLFMMAATVLCVSSFLVVGIFSKNTTEKSFYYNPGLIERAEAFIFFILMVLLPNLEFSIAIIYIVLVTWTALFRLYEFHKNIGRNKL
ncbi:MAG: archaetidylinositol phosphate synthase [Francisellaceae bacterium]|jgi:archaetidylinositol phosphate synthase